MIWDKLLNTINAHYKKNANDVSDIQVANYKRMLKLNLREQEKVIKKLKTEIKDSKYG